MTYLYAVIITLMLVSTAMAGDGMVLIKAGYFVMGGSGRDVPDNEKPAHRVFLHDFYMDIYEVTNGEYVEFLNSVKPSDEERKGWVVIRDDLETEERKKWWPTEIVYKEGSYRAVRGFENHPVLSVSWFGADAYCRWKGKRLPTEAEWEKAARGGVEGKAYPWGNAYPTQGVVFGRVWEDRALPAPTMPVGSYLPNGYGLYDMAGNVSEWVYDWYDPDYYKVSPDDNPRGPGKGVNKVIRGGGWMDTALNIRVSSRFYMTPKSLPMNTGFRCARD